MQSIGENRKMVNEWLCYVIWEGYLYPRDDNCDYVKREALDLDLLLNCARRWHV